MNVLSLPFVPASFIREEKKRKIVEMIIDRCSADFHGILVKTHIIKKRVHLTEIIVQVSFVVLSVSIIP